MKNTAPSAFGLPRSVVAGLLLMSVVQVSMPEPSPVPVEYLVGIEFADGMTCGAITAMDGSFYVIASTRAISGQDRLTFKTLSGESIIPKKIELAMNRDLARLLIDTTNGLKTASSWNPEFDVMMLQFRTGSPEVEPVFGVTSDSDAGVLEVETSEMNLVNGLPTFNQRDEFYGMASEERSYTFKRGGYWVEEIRQKVYPLEGAQWVSPSWKKYNAQYGDLLRDADIFRDELYALTKLWVDSPKSKIEITSEMNLEIKRWIKKHNGMINRAESMSTQHGNTVRGDAFRAVRKSYQDNGRDLIAMARKKANTLEFFANDRGATAFLKEECNRLVFELELYAAYILEHLRKSKDLW